MASPGEPTAGESAVKKTVDCCKLRRLHGGSYRRGASAVRSSSKRCLSS